MIVYVHSDDVYDRGRTFGRHRRLSDVEHITVSPSQSIDAVARAIIRTAGNLRSIWLLIFNSHGGSGHVNIGTGLDYMSVYELAPVQPYMTPRPGGRGVEIHSCNVAAAAYLRSQTPAESFQWGEEFMKRMASVLNCNVRGSTEFQLGYEESVFGPNWGTDDYGRFEGGFTMAQPTGRISRHQSIQGNRSVRSCGL